MRSVVVKKLESKENCETYSGEARLLMVNCLDRKTISPAKFDRPNFCRSKRCRKSKRIDLELHKVKKRASRSGILCLTIASSRSGRQGRFQEQLLLIWDAQTLLKFWSTVYSFEISLNQLYPKTSVRPPF